MPLPNVRVAFDVGPLKPDPAGVGTYVRELARAVADLLGPDRMYLVGALPDAVGLPPALRRRSRPTGPYSAWVLGAGPSDIASTDCDVVHHTDGLVAIRRPKPTVVTIQDLTAVSRWRDHRMVRLARIPFVLAAPRLADAVVTPSQASADEIVRITRTPSRRIHVVPLAARAGFTPKPASEVDEVCRRLGVNPSGYLLVPGTIEPRKNGLRLVRAFERAASERRLSGDVDLVFAGGPGWKAEPVLAAIRESAYRERMKVLGYVSDRDLATLMTGAAGVAYVSLAEGFGLPILEAMSCGTPVMTSKCSSMPEVAGGAAFLVNPTDIGDISRAMTDLLGMSAAARTTTIQAGFARASEFSWDRTAADTVRVYEMVA